MSPDPEVPAGSSPTTGDQRPWVTWRLAGLFVIVAGVAAAGVVIWQLTREVQNLRAAKASTEEYGRVLDGHRQQMQAKYKELTTQYQQTVADRDNLLAQVTRLAGETEQAQAERELLDQDLRRIAGEREVFERELLALQQEHTDLQVQQQTMEQERRHLEGELAKLKERSAEKRLKTALEDSQRQYKELMAQRREAQREATRLKSQQKRLEAEVAQLKGRLTPLEDRYAKLLLDHRTLKKQSAKIPGDVTEIAREHQRLLKELADTHYNTGVAFAKRKDYVRAAIEFRKAIELRPDDADAHYNLGVIYAEHVPDRERALTFFRKYLTIKPGGTSANWAKQYIATWQAWEAKERLE